MRHATSSEEAEGSALGVRHGSPLLNRLFAATTYDLQALRY